jgi:hypothetical protein
MFGLLPEPRCRSGRSSFIHTDNSPEASQLLVIARLGRFGVHEAIKTPDCSAPVNAKRAIPTIADSGDRNPA